MLRKKQIIMSTLALIFIMTIVPCFGQRPFYAGLHNIGYPDVTPETLNSVQDTGIIPAQLNGDRGIANQLAKLPEDKQPFFFLNKEIIAQHNNNGHTYQLRPRGYNN